MSTVNLQQDTQIKKFMQMVPVVCEARHLPIPQCECLVTFHHDRLWAFAVLNVSTVEYKLEAYHAPALLDQLSTLLDGMQVTYSNSSGLRFAALIEGPAALPDSVAYPDQILGQLPIGVDPTGRAITTNWSETPHLAVVGKTGSGKSSFIRIIAAAAIKNGDKLLIADPPGTTLRMLNGHPSLLAPIAQTPEEIQALLMTAARVAEERSGLYAALESQGAYPEKLEEYNQLVEAGQRLPRVVIIIDEMTAMCDLSGGKHSPITKAINSLAWQVRKFGLHFVVAGQSFNVEYVGPVKNEMLGVCFEVKKSEISRSVVGRSGAESIRTPGRALTERWGLVQTYFLPKEKFIEMTSARSDSNEADRILARRCRDENDSKFTLSWLEAIGIGQQEAKRLRDVWRQRGWIAKDATRDNAECLTAVCWRSVG